MSPLSIFLNKNQTIHTEAGYQPGITDFDALMALSGEVFRTVKDRQTHKLKLGNESVFIKKHFGVGWLEILKNLLTLKWPVIGARNEWQAIQKLNKIGIATTPFLMYGERGCNPARKQSFVITRDLGDIVTLETLCQHWQHEPPTFKLKQQLIVKVAELAGLFHAQGMWHRDFYLCHFSLLRSDLETGNFRLHLMDLHRVEVYTRIPRGKRLKDLAGLYFSAMHIGLTKRDVFRFLRVYYKQPLRQVLSNTGFLLEVERRAKQLDIKLQRKRQAGISM
jgi:heptose I phosphotransferase